MSLNKRILTRLLACFVGAGLLVATAAPRGEAQKRLTPRADHMPRGVSNTARTYTNPIFDFDFPDPTVIRGSDGWYYAYATQTILEGRMHNFQVARSRELIRWERMPDAQPVKPDWATQTQLFWAPDVQQRADTFYMYFSAGLNQDLAAKFKQENRSESSKEDVFCLGVATSKAPGGPFTDSGRPLKCGLSFVDIDPMAFDDPKTGKKYLYWGSGFKPIKVQELSDDRLTFRLGTKPVDLVKPDKNIPFQTLIEGVWVVERNGYYYLFYSGENCCHGPLQEIKYAVMVARSKSPTGPFETLAQATGGKDSVILRRNEKWMAPGHNSVVTDAAGQDWITYHAINVKNPYLVSQIGGDRNVNRVMLADRLFWRDGWPHVELGSPSTTRQTASRAR